MNKIAKAALIGCGVLVVGAVTIGRSESEKKKREAEAAKKAADASAPAPKDTGSATPPVAPAPAQPARPVEVAPIDVTAKQLFADYDANEIAAEGKYKGKLLRISGTISNIGKDVLGDPYITLGIGDPVYAVQCMFGDAAALAELKKGQKLTVRCKDPGKMGNVIVRSCAIDK